MSMYGIRVKAMKKTLFVEAQTENLYEVTDFVEAGLEEAGCTMKEVMRINLAVEEIFVNIAHYAYGRKDAEGRIIPDTGAGPVEIILDSDPSRVELTFIDEGLQYDPLKKEDPDTTLSVEDREVGGLGIFMVKKIMDDVSYQYQEGRNRLTLVKYRTA